MYRLGLLSSLLLLHLGPGLLGSLLVGASFNRSNRKFIITSVDYIIPIIGVKKLGGSKGGLIGASIGLITGLIIMGPIGIFLGSFIGAIAGEMINKKNFSDSLKPALGSLIGILIGSGIKFCLSLIYLFFFLNIFWTYKENFF